MEEDGHVFIVKEGRDIHRGEGVNLLTRTSEKSLKSKYGKGKYCGKEKDTI